MKGERKCESILDSHRKIEREILFNLNPGVRSHPEFYLTSLSQFHMSAQNPDFMQFDTSTTGFLIFIICQFQNLIIMLKMYYNICIRSKSYNQINDHFSIETEPATF